MSKSFEEKMEMLEEIVAELENGELNLDDSVSKFEECNKILEEAEKKITILVEKDGKITEEDFEANNE